MAGVTASAPGRLVQFADLTDKSIDKIVIKATKEAERYSDKYYSKETTQDKISKDSSVSGLHVFGYTPENASITSGAPVQGFDKSFTQVFFDGMIKITRDLWEYGIKTRKIEAIVNQITLDAIRTTEKILCNPLVNLTTSSYTDTAGVRNFTHSNTGGDSTVLSSASHTREDGGTAWSNIISDGTTSNMDFDYDALKALERTAVAISDPIGETMNVSPDLIIAKKGGSAAQRFKEIMPLLRNGGMKTMPGGNDNDDGVTYNFDLLEIPYLTSNTAWFAIDTKMMGVGSFGLQMKKAKELELDAVHVDYETKLIMKSITSSFDYGFNDARNILCSTGLDA